MNGLLQRAETRRSHDRTFLPNKERANLVAGELPLELAFLADEDFSLELMIECVGASPEAVWSLDWLLSEGKIIEEAYYRALATHLGCEYYTGDPPLADSFDAVKGLRCGVGPLEPRTAGSRILVAPNAHCVPRLIEATRSGSIRSGSFTLASPQRFASLVRAYRGSELLNVALDRLPPSLTAREGMSGFQTAAVGVAAILAFFLGISNWELLQALSSAALWLIFSASVTLRSMAAIASAPEIFALKIPDAELPNYTVVVALYREASVVEDLVKAIDALDYPKGKLDIKLVVEQRDVETFSRIVELRLPARYEVVVAPLGKPQTKPRALNIALSSARGELIVVYDAEDIPATDQLRLAASRFAADKDLDCLQARLVIRNHGELWLSKVFAIEYAILFDVINPGLCSLNLPIPLGGTSNHFRVRSLVAVGAWDEWNVTEDADLGIRLSRFGYRVKALDFGHFGGSSLRDCKLVSATRAMAKGLDADVDRSFEAADLFLARPWTSTSGCGDDLNCRGHIRMHVLASFRGRNNLACVDRRTGCADAMAGDDRRLYLHPCALRCLDRPPARARRRQIPAFESDRKHACAPPRLLSPGQRGDLGGYD